ncbi:MAG: Gfo/Idh/MocA family oxidoreductase [Clostridia bacterium]|nr:Gfo/Idh/MocA family oxidoreductase [Clostridia bacterium]
MKRKHLKIGLLGFGSMGKAHTYAIQNLGFFYQDLPFSAEIVGVCTTSMEKSESVCREFGFSIPTVNEDELIFSPDIDIIDVCTPNVYHYETLKKAIAADKHIYCEKPLCISAAEAREVSRLADNSARIQKIVFNNRYIPAIMRAKELIDEGRIGRILSFDAAYLHSSAVSTAKNAGWKQNKDICGGGVLFDLGSHVIDMIYHLCGEFEAVSAASQIAFPTRTGMDGKPWQTNADEAFYMLTRLKNGATGTIRASKICPGANDDLFFEIYGEKGSLKYSLMEPNWLWFYDNTLEEKALGGNRGFTKIEAVGRYPLPSGVFPSQKAPIGWLSGHVESYYNFLNSVSNETKTNPNFKDAAYVQEIMEAAYRSAESGTWIKI